MNNAKPAFQVLLIDNIKKDINGRRRVGGMPPPPSLAPIPLLKINDEDEAIREMEERLASRSEISGTSGLTGELTTAASLEDSERLRRQSEFTILDENGVSGSSVSSITVCGSNGPSAMYLRSSISLPQNVRIPSSIEALMPLTNNDSFYISNEAFEEATEIDSDGYVDE